MSASRHAADCGRPIAVDPARQRPKRDHAAAARRPATGEAYANAALTHAARLPLLRLLEAAKGSSALARWRSLARISRKEPRRVACSRTGDSVEDDRKSPARILGLVASFQRLRLAQRKRVPRTCAN